MNIRQFYTGKAIGIIVVVVVIITGIIYAAIGKSGNTGTEIATSTLSYQPYEGSLTGKETCLPHKDMSGPQTLECAIGMMTDTGEYYVLDFTAVTPPESIHSGSRFTASGLITPIENLNTDHWQKYDVKGVLSVKDIKVEAANTSPLPGAPVGGKESSTGKCYVGGCSSQLCTGQPDAMSTCEYRSSYACYKTAICERQATGVCGWTETPELTACLSASQ